MSIAKNEELCCVLYRIKTFRYQQDLDIQYGFVIAHKCNEIEENNTSTIPTGPERDKGE